MPDGNTEPGRLQPIENPDPVPVPLRDHQPLQPWTGYPVVNQNGTRRPDRRFHGIVPPCQWPDLFRERRKGPQSATRKAFASHSSW
ncbi:hypothetical protein [Lentzea aerocolonigenes]|uniref:hypothetical protein n=1 Tax=Lentzea aerocolonigenes TaxID=68170 RepID=UPI0004C39647|nr:hypothetical protein [Lentzea aerocolonigenes]MCP2243409.1 hypothetical protein [Lentzea aerocolonigenes]